MFLSLNLSHHNGRFSSLAQVLGATERAIRLMFHLRAFFRGGSELLMLLMMHSNS